MLGFLYRILVGRFNRCDHKWKIIKPFQIENKYDNLIGYGAVMYCENCGEIKKKELI